MIGRRTPSPIRVWRSWYRATFGSAVAVSGTGQGKTPQSLAAPAIAGFHPIAENGTKAALTTGMTTDRKSLIFFPAVVSWQKTEYPGVAQLVGRDLWDVEVGCSSHLTRTKIPLKSLISEGFFLFFVYCGAGFELPYAFSLYSRFPWPASTTTIPSSASCCKMDSVRLKLVPRDLESANRSLVGWSVR